MLDKLKKIIKDYAPLCQNPDLKLLDFEKLIDLNKLKKSDKNAQKLTVKMERLVKKITNLEQIDIISSLYDTYSEAITYLQIKNKFSKIEYLESKGSSQPSLPDFKCLLIDSSHSKGIPFYIEVKTPNIKESKKSSHKQLRKQEIMETALNNNAELDAAFKKAKQKNKGQFVCVAHVHPTPDPLSPTRQDELKYSGKINRTIEICNEMIKNSQFVRDELNFMLFNLTRIEKSVGYISDDDLVPNIINPHFDRYPKIDSGFLWHVAFGHKGYPIWGGTYGSPLEGHLEIDGILVQHPEYAGIIFLAGGKEFYGFYNASYICNAFNSNHSESILTAITGGKINNDLNNYGYLYITDAVKKINATDQSR